MTPHLSLTDKSTCDQALPHLYQPGRPLLKSFVLSSCGRLVQALSAHPYCGDFAKLFNLWAVIGISR